MSSFREARNVELSTIYYLETQIDASWTDVNVEKSFTKAYSKDLAVPIITIELFSTIPTRLEIGSNTLENRHLINIDIFASSNGQRIDLASFIDSQLQEGWTYYTHSHPVGDNTTLTRTSAGTVKVQEWITDSKIITLDSIDEKDRFRHLISFTVKKGS